MSEDIDHPGERGTPSPAPPPVPPPPSPPPSPSPGPPASPSPGPPPPAAPPPIWSAAPRDPDAAGRILPRLVDRDAPSCPSCGRPVVLRAGQPLCDACGARLALGLTSDPGLRRRWLFVFLLATFGLGFGAFFLGLITYMAISEGSTREPLKFLLASALVAVVHLPIVVFAGRRRGRGTIQRAKLGSIILLTLGMLAIQFGMLMVMVLA